jgi:hypothetical protein
MRRILFVISGSILFLTSAAKGQKTATTNQVITSPAFINLYWDTAWDSDNPTLKAATIDAATQAVVQSAYLAGLSEYGVTSASFLGSFLPDPGCPSNVGRITPSGVITEFPFAANRYPRGITAGPDGNLWFGETSAIGRITVTGIISEFPLPNPGDFPPV